MPKSGLATIERILDGIDDIAFAHLKPEDVVRHALGKIVAAYDRHTRPSPGDHSRTRAASSQPFDDKNKENATKMSVEVTNETAGGQIDGKIFPTSALGSTRCGSAPSPT